VSIGLIYVAMALARPGEALESASRLGDAGGVRMPDGLCCDCRVGIHGSARPRDITLDYDEDVGRPAGSTAVVLNR